MFEPEVIQLQSNQKYLTCALFSVSLVLTNMTFELDCRSLWESENPLDGERWK